MKVYLRGLFVCFVSYNENMGLKPVDSIPIKIVGLHYFQVGHIMSLYIHLVFFILKIIFLTLI